MRIWRKKEREFICTFIWATWPIHMCGVTQLYVQHDPFTCATCPMRTKWINSQGLEMQGLWSRGVKALRCMIYLHPLELFLKRTFESRQGVFEMHQKDFWVEESFRKSDGHLSLPKIEFSALFSITRLKGKGINSTNAKSDSLWKVNAWNAKVLTESVIMTMLLAFLLLNIVSSVGVFCKRDLRFYRSY